jgi:transporter family-2 protein
MEKIRKERSHMMTGILFATFAGIFIAVQSALNSRLNEKLGLWESTVTIHSVGLLFALTMMLFFGNRNFRPILQVNRLYLLGGMFGVLIVFSAMIAYSQLGATSATIVLLLFQVIAATVIDTFGLFSMNTIALTPNRIFGIMLMIAGILVFNFRKG